MKTNTVSALAITGCGIRFLMKNSWSYWFGLPIAGMCTKRVEALRRLRHPKLAHNLRDYLS